MESASTCATSTPAARAASMQGRITSRMMRSASRKSSVKPIPTQKRGSIAGPSSQPMFQQCMTTRAVLSVSSSMCVAS
jgi:hypothetical protein